MENSQQRQCLCCLIFKKLNEYDKNILGKLERYCRLCACIPPHKN